jgi:hypothetical protein
MRIETRGCYILVGYVQDWHFGIPSLVHGRVADLDSVGPVYYRVCRRRDGLPQASFWKEFSESQSQTLALVATRES